MVQYTSGAIGILKPVLVTAGSAAHNIRMARKSYDLHPNSIIISWLPQYHDCGLMFLLLTIVSGATCVLTSPGTFVNRPRLWLELISEEENIELGLVVYVKSGSVPKTTSSKIQRRAAKNKLVGGKMSVVMEVRFGHYSNFLLETVRGNNGKDEGRGRRGQEERKVATEDREEIFLSLSSTPSLTPSILSLP